jgi:beta-galactosidase
VKLILNGKSLGEKRLVDFGERIIFWDVPNEPGTLEAIAKTNGAVVATHKLKTAGPAIHLQLISDRDRLEASGQDLAYVEARMVDESGNIVPHMQTVVLFKISGPGSIAGVDNGDLDSQEEFKAKKRQLRDGRCLASVQSAREPGVLRLKASWGGMVETSIEIEVK